MGVQIKHISSVALATIGSRVLGLLRDVLIFAVLGVGAVNSAFVLAFTLPNLFRRLLGEGALTSALVPVLSAEMQKGKSAGFAVLNRVISRLVLVLLILMLVGAIALMCLRAWPGLAPRWYLGADLSIVLLPYLVFICLAAMVSAQLNVLDRFLIPAATPILLNLAMIAGLAAGVWWAGEVDPHRRVWWLCGGVLAGGCLQLAAPWFALRRSGWSMRWDLRATADTREITRLFLPGVAGAAIFQINTIVSRLLAYGLNADAAGILYLANRLVELPLGVFAISITTVYFPLLARQASAGDAAVFARTYERGLRLIASITLPAAVGLAVLSQPILTTLFEWGLFESSDVARTSVPLAIFSLGLPLYAWSSIAIRGLHSWRDMVSPVRIGAVNAALNLGLSLALMGPFGEPGLAAANVFAGVVFTLLLEIRLRKRLGLAPSAGLARALLRMALAAVVMGGVVALIPVLLQPRFTDPKLGAAAVVMAGLPVGVLTYGCLLWLLRVPELTELWRLLPGTKRRMSTDRTAGGVP